MKARRAEDWTFSEEHEQFWDAEYAYPAGVYIFVICCILMTIVHTTPKIRGEKNPYGRGERALGAYELQTPKAAVGLGASRPHGAWQDLTASLWHD